MAGPRKSSRRLYCGATYDLPNHNLSGVDVHPVYATDADEPRRRGGMWLGGFWCGSCVELSYSPGAGLTSLLG
ncbi:hypothetical protein T484DRAFT_1936419 [Baffinella frigidus]|nr:hypothetical protein T484DRAFT_1936419 [Cryptophyta sp. CCMP2293]